MPRAPRQKFPHGRPVIDIDWNIVDRCLEAGCNGTEVAAYIGVCPDTLYDRCCVEKGVVFSAYKHEKMGKGNVPLRLKQYQQAMSGNTRMLIWLGKNNLGQTDNTKMQIEQNLTSCQKAVLEIPDNGRRCIQK